MDGKNADFARRVMGWDVRQFVVTGWHAYKEDGKGYVPLPDFDADPALIPEMMAAIRRLAGCTINLQLWDDGQWSGDADMLDAEGEIVGSEMCPAPNLALLAVGLAVADAVGGEQGR